MEELRTQRFRSTSTTAEFAFPEKGGRNNMLITHFRNISRLFLLSLCSAGFILAGCGTSGTSPIPHAETCLADKPELRFWTRDNPAVTITQPQQTSKIAKESYQPNLIVPSPTSAPPPTSNQLVQQVG